MKYSTACGPNSPFNWDKLIFSIMQEKMNNQNKNED